MSVTSKNPFNHDVAAADTPTVNVNFNGKWIEVPKGTNVVEVARQHESFLPHYCYHPKLSISGNCRMCLFEMAMPKMDKERKPIMGEDGKPELNWLPRPMIGCATQVSEGMGIRTESNMANECRNGVMEFLLINHPLDCPICDQAGECKLQEFSSEYGTGESRFVENKVTKPKNQDIGERIVLDDERCILCSRCVRFAKEVVKDDVLGFVERGSFNTLTVHPGKRFDNPYSLNTVDICPVGALTSKDFRFKMRVWFLKEAKSVCTGCARGCNITIGSREGTVYRYTPRTNESVNSHWMCDYGRFIFHDIQGEDRILDPQVKLGEGSFSTTWQDVFSQVGDRLKEFEGSETAILASAQLTNEELYVTSILAEEKGISLTDVVPRKWEGDDFLKVSDKNPNAAGARLMGLSKDGANHDKIVSGVRDGSIKCLIVINEDATDLGLTADDLGKLDLLVFAGLVNNATAEKAHYVLPIAAFTEKRGSMINVNGRLQRLNASVVPAGRSMELWELILGLRARATGGNGIHTIVEVFKSMAEKHAVFADLSLGKIGDLGVELELDAAIIPDAEAKEETDS